MPGIVQRMTPEGGTNRAIAWNTHEAVYFMIYMKSSGGIAAGTVIPLEISAVGVSNGSAEYRTSGLDGVEDGTLYYNFASGTHIVGSVRAPYTSQGPQGVTSPAVTTAAQARDLTDRALRAGDVIKLKHADIGDPFPELETTIGASATDALWQVKNPTKLRQTNTVRTIIFGAHNPELNYS